MNADHTFIEKMFEKKFNSLLEKKKDNQQQKKKDCETTSQTLAKSLT